jgi:hypothetical protein
MTNNFSNAKSPNAKSLVVSQPAVRASMTGVLSAVAGKPCAMQPRRGREGSFLVLVVGTLALLAVITIVYVALGNADSRTRSASQSRVQQDEIAPKVGEWISTVVADDALATEFTGEVSSVTATSGLPDGAGFRALERRETSDAPGVRPNLSTAVGTPDNRVFDPVGSVNPQVRQAINTAANADDPLNRIPASDPFLASMVPVNFNYTLADGSGISSAQDPTRPYLYDLDWLSISNFAPDGAFVNTENLRGNFRATSLQLRANKTLWDVNGVEQTVQPPVLVFGNDAEQDNPAHWTMYQQRAFRPGTLTSQWADADGDGMLDSRLFEMVDGFAGVGRRVAPSLNSPTVRYFVAARAIDLSGMVNLTTATEFTTGANNTFVFGATPGDVDLRRLLTQADTYADQNPTGANGAIAGYQGLIQDPTDLGGTQGFNADLPQNYAQYTEQAAFRAGSSAYAALKLSLATNTIVSRDVIDGNNARLILGEQSYTVTLDNSALGQYAAQLKNLPNLSNADQFKQLQSIFSAPYPATGNLPTNVLSLSDWASQRTLAWDRAQERFAGGAYSTSTAADGMLPGGLFSTADLGELLNRHGVNSDERSAIEVVLGGRDDTNGPLSQRFDPLRSNRPESLEMIRFDLLPNGGIDMDPAPDEVQDRTMRLFASDIRRYITPLNGSRQLRSQSSFITAANGVVSVDADRLQGNELKLNLRSILDTGDVSARGDLAELYKGYAEGLAPFSYLDGAWAIDQSTGGAGSVSPKRPTRTLSYGYRGPEAALITAAHMAVNLTDYADADSRPSSATVVLSAPALAALNPLAPPALPASTSVLDPLNNFLPWFATRDRFNYLETNGEQANRRLALDEAKLAPANTQVVAPAVNVYGVEPQIFVTQVSTLTMYVDIAETVPPPGNPSENDPVEIDPTFPDSNAASKSTPDNKIGSASATGNRSADESEVLARLIAFKVVNPFEVPVTLSGSPFSDGRLPRTAVTSDSKQPISNSDRWANGDEIEIKAFDTLAAGSNDATRIRVDGLRDHQYIRVGEGQEARYYLLMSLEQKTDAAFVYRDPPATSPDRNAPPITLNPITIQPGQSAILYAVSEPPARIAERLDRRGGLGQTDGVDAKDLSTAVDAILTRHFAADIKNPTDPTSEVPRYWIPLYAPINTVDPGSSGVNVDSGLQNVDRFVDVIPADPATPGPRSVTLWRADRRIPSELTPIDATALSSQALWTGQNATATVAQVPPPALGEPPDIGDPAAVPNEIFPPNQVGNDVLLDRFKIPFLDTLDSAVPQATGDIRMDGTSIGGAEPNDKGVSLILGRSYRRPGDPGFDYEGGATPPGVTPVRSAPSGMLPAYCIEPKYVESSAATKNAWNRSSNSPLLDTAPFTIDARFAYEGDPSSGSVGGATSFGGAFKAFDRDLVSLLIEPRTRPPQLVTDMGFTPPEWKTTQMVANTSTVGSEGIGYPGRVFATTHGEGVRQATNLVDRSLFRYYNDMYPSLLQAGIAKFETPATPTTSNIIQSDRFRQFVFNSAGVQQAQVLADGRSVDSVSTLRLTDLLLPLGLGPMEMPVGGGAAFPGTAALDPNNFAEARRRYTTLGEAVAIAMGYEVSGPALTAVSATAYADDPALWLAPRDATGSFRLPVPTVPAPSNPEDALRSDASKLLMFDNGNLATDRFVPFVDYNGDGVANGVANDQEPTWGLGIPAAASVLEQFSTVQAPTGFTAVPPNNPQAVNDYVARRVREQLTTSVPGLININTAPVAVLRTLPMASPVPTLKTTTDQADLVAPRSVADANYRVFETGVNSYDNNPFLQFRVSAAGNQTLPVIDQSADIAPTLAAYRDLYPERFRTDASIFMAQRIETQGLNAAVRTSLITQPSDIYNSAGPVSSNGADGLANRIAPMLWTWTRATPLVPDELWTRTNQTRERSTAIPGIRSQPGFRSTSELIFARALWPDAAANENIGVTPVRAEAKSFRQQIVRGLPTNPDFLGYDQLLGAPPTAPTRAVSAAFFGLDPLQRHTLDGDTRPNPNNNPSSPNDSKFRDLRNTSSEKLIVPGAMIASTTTRSDVFAVWFTIFGFRESDVPAAGTTDPILPSIQRRFLMVIDRSNVTQLGEKPKIVLFKEVPM